MLFTFVLVSPLPPPPLGVTKRCRLSLPTNSALVYESKCGGIGGGGRGCRVSANEYSCAHHVTWSPNKLRRSIYIFNLCPPPPVMRRIWMTVDELSRRSRDFSPRRRSRVGPRTAAWRPPRAAWPPRCAWWARSSSARSAASSPVSS
jgi:hypothetical protein